MSKANPVPREAPMSAVTTTAPTNADVFASAAEKAAEMTEYLASTEAFGRRHDDLEEYAEHQGREWIRRMLQGHYDLRGAVERVVPVRGRDGTCCARSVVQAAGRWLRSSACSTSLGSLTRRRASRACIRWTRR